MYLRVSLTDRCNLRCTYCMPEQGMEWIESDRKLDVDEFASLAQLFIDLGVRTIRLTGGEPMLFTGLVELVERLAACRPGPELSLTTNGIGLADRAHALAQAGLTRLNVSVDTLDHDTFKKIARRDRLTDVLNGIDAAMDAGLSPIKINTVLQRDLNLDEAPALLEWALQRGLRLRFIEHMPLDAQRGWRRDEMVTADEIEARLRADFKLEARPSGLRGSAPAEEFTVVGGPNRMRWSGRDHRVGIIASVTRPFCRDCDRLRLTSDGQLRTCLFATDETDLRTALRSGSDQAELTRIVDAAVAGKQAGHEVNSPMYLQPIRPMSAIGG